jgi:lysine N6-hydroxylase
MNTTYDFIGIGIGPFNLGLAALTSNQPDKKSLFFDRNKRFDWHPGMMLQSAKLQTPFLSDLVTLADPTHPLSFLNYAKSIGKIYSFYIKEDFFLMRKEYNQYCQWAVSKMDNLRFGVEVVSVEYLNKLEQYVVNTVEIATKTHKSYYTKQLVLGVGNSPVIPDSCRSLKNNLIHSSQYLAHKAALQKKNVITLVGSGQSAAEIFYDLLCEIDQHDYELNWITRSPRFFPLEYSKLTLEMTSPEYVDYFYQLPKQKRQNLINQQKGLYKGINTELINEIFDLLYVKNLTRAKKINLITNSSLQDCVFDEKLDKYTLTFHQQEQSLDFICTCDGLILASGYQTHMPSFLEPIKGKLCVDNQANYDVARNYSIDHSRSQVFVQNAELYSHGFVTPDLGMACYRNSILIRELYGREVYPVENKIAFQTFDINLAESSSIQLLNSSSDLTQLAAV